MDLSAQTIHMLNEVFLHIRVLFELRHVSLQSRTLLAFIAGVQMLIDILCAHIIQRYW